MGFPSYTYTFTNGSTADATQVNQNFTDILNGISDTTKDISVNNATAAGTATLNGNVVLGNSSTKTITFNGSVSSSIPVGANASYDFGSSTKGMNSYYIAGTSTFTTRLMSAATASWTITLPATAGSSGQILSGDGSGNLSWRSITNPTVQKFTSGSGTYTLPTSPTPIYIRVRLVGGGGGGGGSGSGATGGGGGGNTTFGSSLLTGNGGSGGAGGQGGAGGTASLGSGPVGVAVDGARGDGCLSPGVNGANNSGGAGGASPFGGAGGGNSATAGDAARTNSGSGGGGAGITTNTTIGGGGGAGGYVDAIITSPSSTYAYSVGGGGSQGTGTNGGGSGGAGLIIVEEFYQ